MSTDLPAWPRRAVLLIAAIAIVSAMRPSPLSAQSATANVLANVRQLEALIHANDTVAITEFFEPVPLVCPAEGLFATACIGLPDGTSVDGFRWGLYASEGGHLSREQLPAAMSEGLVPAEEFRLRTISFTGYGDCPDCAILVFSSNFMVNTSFAPVIIFQVRQTADLSVFSGIGGLLPASDQEAMLLGGTLGPYVFVPPDRLPLAPATGTGSAPPSNSNAHRLPVLAGLITLLAAGLFARAARRNKT